MGPLHPTRFLDERKKRKKVTILPTMIFVASTRFFLVYHIVSIQIFPFFIFIIFMYKKNIIFPNSIHCKILPVKSYRISSIFLSIVLYFHFTTCQTLEVYITILMYEYLNAQKNINFFAQISYKCDVPIHRKNI